MKHAPSIDRNAIPEAEHAAAEFIGRALGDLQDRVREFKHCLSLARHSQAKSDEVREDRASPPRIDRNTSQADIAAYQENMKAYWAALEKHDEVRSEFRDWQFTAVKHGALTAYQFWMNTQSINDHLGVSPVLRSLIDTEEKKRATSLFSKTFPSIASVRLSAAHAGELGSSAADIDKHAIRHGNTDDAALMNTLFIGSSLTVTDKGFLYGASIKGKQVSYDLSDDTVQALSLCTEYFWNSFLPVESRSSQWIRSRA